MAKHYKEEKKTGCFGILMKLIGWLLVLVIVLLAGMIGFLSLTEFKPADTMAVEIEGESAADEIETGTELKIMSWNIGYGALGDNADFFMDGGKMVQTADVDRVNSNMDGIINEVKTVEPDIIFFQEIDRDSTRSHHINELEQMKQALPQYSSSFANNFKVAFLPYPVPPIGKVDSGVATFSNIAMGNAVRNQLPIPFKWPVRMANLKRCVLETRIPVKGTDKQLVLMNLHLEAYDSGSGKVAQTKALAEMLKTEVEKGNYVIAGGDFNQIFSSADQNAYPSIQDNWQPGVIDVNSIDGKWQFLMDEKTPSCRSLIKPLAGADTSNFQFYLIDGFIVSDNIKVDKCETQDLGFVNSDHNPVVVDFKLKK